MTSHQTNGASLEDCHTNFFALTDLCGIKWRKLAYNEGSAGFLRPLAEDPVLISYSKCLSNDILCVWRRVASTVHGSTLPNAGFLELNSADPLSVPPSYSTNNSKELWIFWYGEEPDLTGIISSDLLSGNENEQGSWESGLSYECRSLLFKALHNLIERCLLSRNFVRLGKWFVEPYEDTRKRHQTPNKHLSFSFAFFVHGESTVCASVDVRQHPPIRRISKASIQFAQSNQSLLKVILAPYGLAASLVGQASRMDNQVRIFSTYFEL